jgi:transcriptional regulator with XRE-family HTH domain
MAHGLKNIYQIARSSAGLTQEKSAELLSLSVESLRAYETDRTVPGNEIVCQMVAIYNAQHLAYQHLTYSSEVARQCLPQINIEEIRASLVRLEKEVGDYAELHKDLVGITYDGVISDEERPRFNQILKELDDIVAAIMGLKYARTEK